MAEWGNPADRKVRHHCFRAVKRTQGTETSQYLEEEKSTEMSGVAASETDPSPNRFLDGAGVVGPADAAEQARRTSLEREARDGESPVAECRISVVAVFLSSARYERPGVKLGGPPSKAKDSRVTDSGRVP